ncbi:MAG: EAL domain-containing protein [Gammaproteobacteria bacterium]|nr:EAL domain-containing protein [Gammaproteobacteria bacterium]
MRIDSTFLRSKVARRIFVLFVASALLPIGTLALVSFEQVTGQLTEHGHKQLHRDSKAVAMTVFERLSMLESELELLGSQLVVRSDSTFSLPVHSQLRLRERFDTLRIVTSDGERRLLHGEMSEPSRLTDAQAKHLRKGKAVVWSRMDNDRRSRIFMAVATEKGTLTGEVNQDFLWSVQLDATSVFCILGESGDRLFCSDTVPAEMIASVKQRLSDRQSDRLSWESGTTKFLANYWSILLEHGFHAGQWTIILGKPEAEVLSAMVRFKAVFPPVIAVSILAVVLLSVSQIRRYLVPLERLSQGARQIAERNFSEPVRIESGDEFEELAGSFNAMASRLERQFGTLATMAEIDRLILSTTDADYIVETLLRRLYEVVPCRSVCVAVLDNEGETASLRISREAARNAATSETCPLTDDEIAALRNGPRHWFVESGDPLPGYLGSLMDGETRRILVLPVVLKDGLAAIIAIGIAGGSDFSEEDIGQIREVADRTAVALSNVAWEEKLYHQAHYDALTDLPNRVLLRDRLEQAMGRARREGTCVAVLFLDLDRFKSINDSLGHVAGDLFLKEMGARLSRKLREGDSVVRFGGDEFIIVVPDIPGDIHIITTISKICENILAATIEPFSLEGHEITITSSVGVSIYPQDADKFDDLLKNADTAMYHAKGQGRDNYQFYAQDLNAAAMQRFNMQNDLHRALENDELELFYQPQVDLQSGHLVGAECLLRWQHPELGIVSPSRFIPIAEDTGLITSIGEWVLRTACAQSRVWQNRGLPAVRMAVNLSARQFRSRNLVTVVSQILKDTQLPVQLLELEVTEGAIMTDIDRTISTLRALSEMGVRLAVDDFGTGYSSLAYLAQFPLDVLKIDQSFVRDVVDRSDVACVVSAIVGLAHNLDLTVVAEGVESQAQLEFLRALGCEEIQGYLYSRPLAASDFEELLRNDQEKPFPGFEDANTAGPSAAQPPISWPRTATGGK